VGDRAMEFDLAGRTASSLHCFPNICHRLRRDRNDSADWPRPHQPG
jgi:hypothetical protein